MRFHCLSYTKIKCCSHRILVQLGSLSNDLNQLFVSAGKT